MQQRYYDQGVGRFLSVDPVTPLEQPAASFCRYCYSRGNPYRFTDPDGRDARDFYHSIFGYPSQSSPYRPIEGADRGDAQFMAVVAAPAAAGIACALNCPAAVAGVKWLVNTKQGREAIFAALHMVSRNGDDAAKFASKTHRETVALLRKAESGSMREAKEKIVIKEPKKK